jgi:hypothetical protein
MNHQGKHAPPSAIILIDCKEYDINYLKISFIESERWVLDAMSNKGERFVIDLVQGKIPDTSGIDLSQIVGSRPFKELTSSLYQRKIGEMLRIWIEMVFGSPVDLYDSGLFPISKSEDTYQVPSDDHIICAWNTVAFCEYITQKSSDWIALLERPALIEALDHYYSEQIPKSSSNPDACDGSSPPLGANTSNTITSEADS